MIVVRQVRMDTMTLKQFTAGMIVSQSAPAPSRMKGLANHDR